ncbi:MAG: DinB family protein [Anaerolineales bacterium]|nr:DinB family protein [Anaerolineales bacterium]
MLDFTPVRNKNITMLEFTKDLTRDDLRRLTNVMIDRQLELIAGCTDFDVTFVPVDTNAKDDAAANAADVDLAWTLGHVIVHVTASSEEAAFLAAELARGVPNHGRSRSEVAWETVTTLEQCRARLEESRRMRLATLDVWPDEPHLNNQYQLWENGPMANCISRFCHGLSHDDSHLNQIAEVVRQAQAARPTPKLVLG